ncbi:MAG: hypothetical protein A3C61_02230 [Candidatus Yanofskybacteria bacterium RIFCSPHIGHO2_02_FULL_39_10]|uniref:Uncharacterized protein n=1 Tax=Candidatus Yanofskybacteria bacterium RIFCSPHIGHO2_02_FULL_39_10 TaxID=1802674 RepID=A0A1F8F7U1_9BACT|nr:MAG: hypothetical protein A3C61_02230 [Candidatus Yanofskybacteria bacterium RIFCSPHIGHO2_02_FULL_39_10]
MKKKITIDTLARMTQDQFSKIDERFDGVDATLSQLKEGQQKLEAGQQRIIDVLLEIPSKKAFERLDNKVQTFDARLTSVERKVGK